MGFSEKNIDQKIAEMVKDEIKAMPLREEARIKMIEKAGKAENLMQEKYKELTGCESEFDPEELFRHELRKMLQNAGWLSEETQRELGEVYKKEGGIRSLGESKEKYFFEEKDQHKISEEAKAFEDMAMLFIKHVRGGIIDPSFFMTQLSAHLDKEAERKKLKEMEIVPQKKIETTDDSEQKAIKDKKEEEEYNTFVQMSEARHNWYVVEKSNELEKGSIGSSWQSMGESGRGLFKQLKSDPAISSDLKRWTKDSIDLRGGLEEVTEFRASKTIREAELSGLHQQLNLHI